MENKYAILINALNDESIQEVKNEIVDDTANALMGDPVAALHVIKDVVKTPVAVRDAIYMEKFRRFLKGIYIDPEDPIRLSNKLFGNDKDKWSNAIRVLQIVDNSENERCLQFIINATRALLLGLIEPDMYFRICRAINDTLYEDLIFLRDNVFKAEPFKGTYSVHGLNKSGLMIQSGIDSNADINEQEYCVSNLGRAVDQFAISFEDEKRSKRYKSETAIFREFDSGISFQKIGDDEIDAIFEKTIMSEDETKSSL